MADYMKSITIYFSFILETCRQSLFSYYLTVNQYFTIYLIIYGLLDICPPCMHDEFDDIKCILFSLYNYKIYL